VLGLGLSLFSWSGEDVRFIGLANYRALLEDDKFGPALRNTLLYVLLSVPPMVIAAFGLAVLVNARWFVGRTIVRTIIFMPTVVSIVAIGFVWRWVLNDRSGLLNWMLGLIGIADTPSWLQDGWWPFAWIVIISVWRGLGFCLVLYLAALSSINESLYEAAELDGASRWNVVRHITWPQTAPTTAFLLVTGVIGALQIFDIVFVITGESESSVTNVLNLHVYRQFTYGQFGYAAAIGAVIFLLTLLATAFQLAVLTRGRRSP
jgi:multiple sugar transport system permease protein